MSWALPTTVSLIMTSCVGEGHCTTHPPPHAQKGKELGGLEEAPTSEHDTAKDSVVPVQGGTVPAVVAELVLTLPDPFSGTLAH